MALEMNLHESARTSESIFVPSYLKPKKMAASDIYSDLDWRGLVYQTTSDNLGAWLLEKPRTVYAGFDPTSDSLHVGSLLPLMTLRRFQKAGHKPLALVGGATGRIGDPSGKSQERKLQSLEQIQANVDGIKSQMEQMLDFDSGQFSAAVVVNNYDWISQFSYIDFLRDVGKNFPVNVMMSKDSIRNRLENPDVGISYTEFSYMLLQAYDFVHLYKSMGCELQVGGSDQWGNVTAGIDLARRMHGAELFGLTCPLLTKTDGSKMGKTESGAIWLDSKKTSPYQFYQYWINVADEDAGKCLRFLTELPHEEIEALDRSREEEPHLRSSQKRLAEAVTELIHGTSGLAKAQQATRIFFGEAIENVDAHELIEIFADVPSNRIAKTELSEGIGILDALVKAGLCKSKGEARRSLAQGGININNIRVESEDRSLTGEDLVGGSVIVLRLGRKRYALLRVDS